MKYTTLPNTDIKSAKFALTMTFGPTKYRSWGHAQMDYALADNRLIFFDTAEITDSISNNQIRCHRHRKL
jgi:hypothetical protein